MTPRHFVLTLAWAALLVCGARAQSQGFSFSQEDHAERVEQQAKSERIAQELSTPCLAAIKNRKIMLLIGEQRSDGYIAAVQQNYGPHFAAINNRLRALGLRTYTPEEIRQQVAQAEIDAYFHNDPDAMLSAAKRLGASFVLRGLITSQATRNPVMNVNQVSVGMQFTLSGKGRVISEVEAYSASYAGADVARMALTLVNEQADEVVAKLYADYCRQARPASGRSSP